MRACLSHVEDCEADVGFWYRERVPVGSLFRRHLGLCFLLPSFALFPENILKGPMIDLWVFVSEFLAVLFEELRDGVGQGLGEGFG